MIVTDRNFRPIRCPQAHFNPCVPAIDVHFGIGRVEKNIIVRKEPGVAIVPAAKFLVTGLYVAEIRLRQLQRYIVVVEVPKSMTIQRKLRVFANSSLQVQILDTAVNLITRQPVFLLKLRAIAAGNDSADREFDPTLLLFWLLFRGRSDGL